MTHRRSLTVASLAVLSCTTGDNNASGRSSLPRFEVSASPSLALTDDGSPNRQFTRALVRRMPSGRVVVGEPDAGRIRVYERDGGLARVLARKGSGPGEMPGRFALGSFGDTIVSFGRPPFSRAGISFFSETAGYAGEVAPHVVGSVAGFVLDRLSTGQFLVRRGTGIRGLRSAPETGRLYPDSATFGVLTLTGADSASVTWLPPVLQQSSFAHPWPGGPLATALAPYIFAPRTFVVASGDRVWIVEGASGAVHAFDATGTLTASMDLSDVPRPFDSGALSAWRANALAEATRPIDSARAIAMLDPVLLPPTMPLVSAAVPGPAGELWLRRFDAMPTAPQEFLVLDRNVHEVAVATVPADVDVQQVGSDFIVGVRTLANGTLEIVELAVRR